VKIAISAGHGLKIRGAAGSPVPPFLDEYDENVKVMNKTADFLRLMGHEVETYTDLVSTSQSENLDRLTGWHNDIAFGGNVYDLACSIHFNCFDGSAHGVECLWVTQEGLAEEVASSISKATGLTNRGGKYRSDLAILNNTREACILVECLFCDHRGDCDNYRAGGFELLCQALATAITGDEADEQPSKPAIPPFSKRHINKICDIAYSHPIADYEWDDRGVAPKGFIEGIALAFGQVYRKLLASHPAAIEMAKARTESDKDALNIYRSEFDSLEMNNENSGPDTLRHLYALMIGHGMRESSGQHCEGRDMSADNVQSDTAEAGLFQTSYNASNASDPEFDNLMSEYGDPKNEATCYFDIFAQEVECDEDDWDCYGSGDGYEFQKLCKDCPPFACETAALTLRNLCNHYGPIIRKEVELNPNADAMLQLVQKYVDAILKDHHVS